MTDTIFADGILDANVTSGVARLTLAQAGSDGKPVAAGKLVMPLVQLPAFVNGLANLLKQVETRMQEQQAQQAVAPEPAPPNGPEAFRFNGAGPLQ